MASLAHSITFWKVHVAARSGGVLGDVFITRRHDGFVSKCGRAAGAGRRARHGCTRAPATATGRQLLLLLSV